MVLSYARGQFYLYLHLTHIKIGKIYVHTKNEDSLLQNNISRVSGL